MIRLIFRTLPLSVNQKKYLKYFYFKSAALLGIVQRPALNGLDSKLEKYMPYKNGVFIEAGANDGVTQSNTWYFENYLEWSGLLVEPLPRLAKLAAKFRRTPVANVALGRPEDDGATIHLRDDDLMSRVTQSMSEASVAVTARSLSALLDEHGLKHIDLLSLDVEGFELSVLAGLDIDRHAPKFILVETAQPEAVQSQLGERYELRDKLSFHDYLFALRV
ncbi:FkbM family methyltransferase [Prosthecodimorpha hirschii]|uniref:FkbM family methyltransferase n=1 Tax=Prosthecodimorpha hirschii TaxID=665126 RepID=UPI0015E351A2|nr:FkbM family methyltransferase [Prosthecomicrobium hirschii]